MITKKLWNIIEGYGLTVGLAAIAQMIWYFYEISVLGLEHTSVFEPDPVVRMVEFILAISGFVALFLTAVRIINRRPVIIMMTHTLTQQEKFSLGIQRKIVRVQA